MTTRGLTLVETLGAVALLAAMGAVCASLFRSARQALEAPDQSSYVAELDLLADALLDEPEAFRIDRTRIGFRFGAEFDVAWPAADHLRGYSEPREPARVRILTSDEADHAWMIIEWRSASVSRWLATPPKENR